MLISRYLSRLQKSFTPYIIPHGHIKYVNKFSFQLSTIWNENNLEDSLWSFYNEDPLVLVIIKSEQYNRYGYLKTLNLQQHEVPAVFNCPRIKFLYTKLIEIENYGKKHLQIKSMSSRLPFRANFPSILTIFKTALVSIIFILELSVLHKNYLELNFQAKRIISRVPCTPVFLRSRTSGFQY